MKVVCVLTRYNEYIDWIQSILKFVDFIYIYNKGENENYFKSFIPLPEDLVSIKNTWPSILVTE